jgi:hypothetical protein
MANEQMAEQIRAALAPHLEPGEQLHAITACESGGLFDFPRIANRNWWVGVTDRRVIVAQQGWSGKVVESAVYSLPREDLVAGRRTIKIGHPTGKLPRRIRFQLLTKLDNDEFRRALVEPKEPAPASG